MALVINTNIASITAQNHAVSSRKEMESAMERLSSGMRINSASDDAAGLAISTRMESQIRGMTKAVQNANDAISLTQTAEGAQQEVTEMLQRIRELAVQSLNSSNTTVDRESLDAEVQQLLEEIDQIAATTKFNNQNLLDGSFRADIQIGDQLDQQMSFGISSLRTSDLGMGSSSASGNDAIVSARLEVSGTSTAATKGSLLNVSGVADGDILINGQQLGSLASAEDIQDVVKIINDSIDNVTASAFNTVVADSVGTGVSDSDDVQITVIPTSSDDTTNVSTAITFTIGAAASLEELAANINTATQGYVSASVNGDGKLVLSNDTGAGIQISDDSAGNATGLQDRDGVIFGGFLKLESTDGSDIRIQNSFQSLGDFDDLEAIGFRRVGEDDGFGTAYSVLGKFFADDTAAETAIGVNDLKINGIDVYNADIDTDSIAGKLEAINAVSAETGVTASAYFERFYDLSDAIADASMAAGDVIMNGVTVDFTSSASGFATNINAVKDITGLQAEVEGNVLRLYGNLNSVTVSYTGTGSATDLALGTAATNYAGIRLDSMSDTPISIDLGDSTSILTTSTAAAGASISIEAFGFKEMNAGAADFASNDPTLGVGGGSAISGVSVATVAGANSAISAIDRALEQVSSSAGNLGAIQNRLNHTINNLQETIVNTSASQSRIQDADYAVESAKLAKQQVLQQAATAMLAQANASSQSVLTLLGG